MSNGQIEQEQFVTDLVLDYIQGTITAEEIRTLLATDPQRSHLLDLCTRSGSLPQQLLEAVGLSAYDSKIRFTKPAVATREGLRRNLALLTAGQLGLEAICEWSTDRLAWDIVQGQGSEDEVVRVIANEFAHGEEYAQRIASSPTFLALLKWHLDHTSTSDSNLTRVGVFLEHWRSLLKDVLVKGTANVISESELQVALSDLLGPIHQRAPTLIQEFMSATRQLGRPVAGEELDELLTCIARTGHPVDCARRMRDV